MYAFSDHNGLYALFSQHLTQGKYRIADALWAGAPGDSGFHTFQVFADGGTALVFKILHFPHPLVK